MSMKEFSKTIGALIVVVILIATGVLWVLSTTTLSMPPDGVKHSVPMEMIVSGGPPKDGIPSIDNPKFVSAAEANAFLSDDEIIFGLFLDGVARAYPTQILVWHEIVNDHVNGRPVLITYCPLCFTGAAFERSINGEAVEFGTSGKLYNSDLVMYDRKTDSYWSQIPGVAIVGKLTGYELTRIPLDHITWREWKKLHPDTEVLSRETGFLRSYGVDPYSSYYTSPTIVFPVKNRDDRLPLKAITYGLEINGKFKAYLVEDVANLGVINDRVGDEDILIVGRQGGPYRSFYRNVDNDTLEFDIDNGRIFDKQTGSEWNINGEAISGEYENKRLEQVVGTVNFWFAWVAFYPETDLYSIGG